MSLSDLDLWSGRTSPAHSVQTKEKTSAQSCKKRSKSSAKPPLFLCLTKGGLQADASLTWIENGALLGEFSMHSFGESPKEDVVSHLSQILEECPHPKYSLSATACQGILRRAERRGKELPTMLKEALERQSLSKSEPDAPGGAKEYSCNETERERCQRSIINSYCIQGNCIDRADTAGCNGKGWAEDVCYTLNTIDRPAVAIENKAYPFDPAQITSKPHRNPMTNCEKCHTLHQFSPPAVVIENHPQDSRVSVSEDGVIQTLSQKMGTGGGNVPLVMCDPYNGEITGDKSATPGVNCGISTGRNAVISLDRASFNQGMNAQYNFEIKDDGKNSTLVAKGPGAVCYCIGNGQADQTELQEKVGALDCMHDQKCVLAVDCRNGRETEINGTLQAKESGVSYNLNNVVRNNYIVRRLTPTECERLQGFPDGWTDLGDWIDQKGKIRKTTDGARYKALGNSIAIPPWTYVLSRLFPYCEEKTMASLFDGIGGFPLIWERLGGDSIWASEIEDFPIAVTTRRFPELHERTKIWKSQ